MKICTDCGKEHNRRTWLCHTCYDKKRPHICPQCGKQHNSSHLLCDACYNWKRRGGTCQQCGKPAQGVLCNECRNLTENRWNWQGGHKDSGGYFRVKSPGHPRADANGYVPEHILVMENILGRVVSINETVHHKNGIRTDNRPENLELWTGVHPYGSRVEDLVSYAHKIINQYDPLYYNG